MMMMMLMIMMLMVMMKLLIMLAMMMQLMVMRIAVDVPAPDDTPRTTATSADVILPVGTHCCLVIRRNGETATSRINIIVVFLSLFQPQGGYHSSRMPKHDTIAWPAAATQVSRGQCGASRQVRWDQLLDYEKNTMSVRAIVAIPLHPLQIVPYGGGAEVGPDIRGNVLAFFAKVVHAGPR